MTEVIELKNGIEVTDPRLGRIPEYDDRSRQFQVRPLLQEVKAENKVKLRASYPAHPTLNQGDYGACTWFALATGLNGSPHRHKPEIGYEEALNNYHIIQHEDEWDGCEWGRMCPIAPGPPGGGSSLIAALRMAKRLGYISSYYWCGAGSGTAIDDVVEAHEYIGGVYFGIPWYQSMFNPRKGGYLEVDPSSGLAGYHAIWSVDFRYERIPGHGNRKVEHIVPQNTWGDWGDKWYGVDGHCYILLSDVEQYLLPKSRYGEAAVIIK